MLIDTDFRPNPPHLGILLAVALAATLPVAAKAQVVAYQGEAKPEPVKEFESPMVLEVPVSGLGSLPPRAARNFGAQLRDYVCDDVKIHTLSVRKGRTRKRQGRLETSLDLEVMLYVRPSYDRLVDLHFSFIKEDEVVLQARKNQIDAEEGYYPKFKHTFKLPVDEFERIFNQEPVPKLKIKMSVEDND